LWVTFHSPMSAEFGTLFYITAEGSAFLGSLRRDNS
jgi:hypothetical protein